MEKKRLITGVAFQKQNKIKQKPNPFASEILSGIQIYNVRDETELILGQVWIRLAPEVSLQNSLRVTLEICFFKYYRN